MNRNSNLRNSFVLLNGQMSGRSGPNSRGTLTVVTRNSATDGNSRLEPRFIPASSLLSTTAFNRHPDMRLNQAFHANGLQESEMQNSVHDGREVISEQSNNTNRVIANTALHPFQLLANRLDSNGHDMFHNTATAFEVGTGQESVNSLFQHPFFAPTTSPYFEQIKKKHVYELWCCHCNMNVCMRAMKAILLANIRVELFSTDTPPPTVNLVFDDYITCNCNCKIRDVACTGCGNVLGYHVTQPCPKCLDSKNNGHFWMYYAENVCSRYRINSQTCQTVFWGNVDAFELELTNTIQPSCYERNHR